MFQKSKQIKSIHARRRAEWQEQKQLGDAMKQKLNEMDRLNKRGDIYGAVNALQEFGKLNDQLSENYLKLSKRDNVIFKHYIGKKK